MTQIYSNSKTILITFDVEDWFQVENFKKYIPHSTWHEKELRVENNTYQLLNTLEGGPVPVKATFFILGWIAEKCPNLIQEIHQRGHEVASHGFNHRLCSNQTPDELHNDLQKSKDLLEHITNEEIKGYRAPSFSITQEALSVVRETGHLYDSSYNSYKGNCRYGSLDLPKAENNSSSLYKISSSFYEVPVSNLILGSRVFPWGGGGYFRLLPSFIHQLGVKWILRKNKCYTFYLHPWEIDPGQPKVSNANPIFRFRHYVNVNRTKKKLEQFISYNTGYNFLTIKEYINKARMDETIPQSK